MAKPFVLEQAFEDVLDPVGRAERALEPGPPALLPDHRQVPGSEVAEPVLVQRDRHPGREDRLSDEHPAASGDLDDDVVGHTRIYTGASPVAVPMTSSLGALLLAGGLGGAIAFLSGLAFAHSGGRVLALGAVGALLACAFQVTVASGELVDPLQYELLNAACLANALGWLAGTLLVARVRVLEYLDAQEAA